MSSNASWLRRTQSDKNIEAPTRRTPAGKASPTMRKGTILPPLRTPGGGPGRFRPPRRLGSPSLPPLNKTPRSITSMQLRSTLSASEPSVQAIHPPKKPLDSPQIPSDSGEKPSEKTKNEEEQPQPSSSDVIIASPAEAKNDPPVAPDKSFPSSFASAPPPKPFFGNGGSGKAHPAFAAAPPPEPPPMEDDDDEDYLFDEPDSPANIVFTAKSTTEKPEIKGGTLEKLVERLTYEKYPDPEYLAAFLLTYRSFTSPTELIDLLITRYNIPKPFGLEGPALVEWEQNKQKAIRLRVFNVIKRWVQQYWHDFQEDSALVDTLVEFVDGRMQNTMESAAKNLKNVIQRKMDGTEAMRTVNFGDRAPTPVIPSNLGGRSPGFMDLDPLEIARQLTLIESNLYTSIKPWEFLGQAWTKANKAELAPGIIAMIHRFNAVSRWVATEIVKVAAVNDRSKVLTRFIEIAQACNKLNNYNAIMEIVSGLNSSSIYRMKLTWANVKRDKIKAYTELRELMSRDKNFQAFREHLHSVDPPCIPYLGVYLTDLTFLEDGNKNYVQPAEEGGDPLINFGKRRKVANVISEVRQYQQTPYNLAEVAFMKEYLTQEDFWSEDECYKRSQELEPKLGPGAAPVKTSRKSKLFGKKRSSVNKTSSQSNSASGGGGKSTPEPEEEIDWEVEEIPDYPFAVGDSKENLIFDIDAYDGVAHPQIRAASLPKLIERVTHPTFLDPSIVSTFLFTYNRFTEPHQLVDLLIKRFQVPKTKNASLEDQYKKEIVMPTRLRVFNLAKQWIDRFFWGLSSDEELMKKFNELAKIIKEVGMPKAAESLVKSLERATSACESAERRVVKQPPPPIMPKVAKANYQLYDFDPEEAVRQMTLKEHALLTQVEPPEILAWTTCPPEERPTLCPTIVSIERRNDQMTNWMAYTIVEPQDTLLSSQMINFWVKVAQRSLAINNFSTFVQVSRALLHPDISKLKVVWNTAGSKAKSAVNRFNSFLKEGQRKLTEKLHTVQPPCVPALSAYLSQLVKIEESHPDSISGLINFEKFSQIGQVVGDIQHYQQTLFALEEVPICQEILKNLPTPRPDKIAELSVPLMQKLKRAGSGATLTGTNNPQRGISKLAKMFGIEEDSDPGDKGNGTSATLKRSATPPRISNEQVSTKTSSRSSSTSADPDALKSSILVWAKEDEEFRNTLRGLLFPEMDAKLAEVSALVDQLKALKASLS